MKTQNKVTDVSVYSLKTGAFRGTAKIDWDLYIQQTKGPGNEEIGAARADTFLSSFDIKRLNITPQTAVWCEQN